MRSALNGKLKQFLCAMLCVALPAGALLMGGCFGKALPQPAETGGTEALTESAAPVTEAPSSTDSVTEAPASAAPETETPATTAPVTEAPASAAPVTEAPVTETPTTAAPAVPQSKEEIVSFFAAAVNGVKSGAAGYTRTAYDRLGETNVTGNSVVDGAIKSIVSGFLTTENEAKPAVCAKGSPPAAEMMPGWVLADPGKVKSAALEPADGKYNVTILMEDEDTPRKSGSHLAEVGPVLFIEDVEAKLKGVSVIRRYEDLHIRYSGYTLSALLTPEGRLVSLRYHADISVELGAVEVAVMTLRDMRFTLENTVTYSDFVY